MLFDIMTTKRPNNTAIRIPLPKNVEKNDFQCLFIRLECFHVYAAAIRIPLPKNAEKEHVFFQCF